jgi:hypothetical protein
MQIKEALSFVALMATAVSSTVAAQAIPTGCAWDLTGKWRVNGRGADLKAGDPVSPGSLVIGKGDAPQHLIALLPDGQRILMECHDQASCSRGFRLPALNEQPDDETIEAFQQISLSRGETAQPAGPTESGRTIMRVQPGLMRAEGVAALEGTGGANVAPVIKSLPPGDYRLILKSDAGRIERQVHWEANQKALSLDVKRAGLYKLTFYGSLNTERMRASLLVVQPSRFEAAYQRLDQMNRTLKEWNEKAPGWPVHDFLSLYLEALSKEPNSESHVAK